MPGPQNPRDQIDVLERVADQHFPLPDGKVVNLTAIFERLAGDVLTDYDIPLQSPRRASDAIEPDLDSTMDVPLGKKRA